MKKSQGSAGARSAQGGFSLLELALVLAVMAVIIGAVVMATRGVRQNAEYSKITQTFVHEWKRVYDEYSQRIGVVPGDNQVAPTRMVNGAETEIGGRPAGRGNLDGALAGVPENYRNTGLKLCNGQGYPKDSVGPGDRNLARQNLRELMLRAGFKMPPGRATGYEDRYVYSDTNGNPVELQVCFQWNPPSTISGAGNVMVLRGLTPDLARYLDQLIDGKADALEGVFRQQDDRPNSREPSSQQPGREWSANNTTSLADGERHGPQTIGTNRDEDRVILLTAHWIMMQ